MENGKWKRKWKMEMENGNGKWKNKRIKGLSHKLVFYIWSISVGLYFPGKLSQVRCKKIHAL